MLVGSCCIIIRESERGWRCPKLQQIPHTLVTSDTRPIVKDKSRSKKTHGYQRTSEEKNGGTRASDRSTRSLSSAGANRAQRPTKISSDHLFKSWVFT